MSKKTPWFKFYTSDWNAGVATLTAEQRGVYFTLLLRAHYSDGPLEYDPEKLAMDCGVTIEAFENALARLIKKGKIIREDGLLHISVLKPDSE